VGRWDGFGLDTKAGAFKGGSTTFDYLPFRRVLFSVEGAHTYFSPSLKNGTYEAGSKEELKAEVIVILAIGLDVTITAKPTDNTVTWWWEQFQRAQGAQEFSFDMRFSGLVLRDKPNLYEKLGIAKYSQKTYSYSWDVPDYIRLDKIRFIHKKDTKFVFKTVLKCKGKDGATRTLGAWLWGFTIKAKAISTRDVIVDKIEWSPEQ
jgi:hypothetical protein